MLVVEDEAIVAHDLRLSLQAMGYEVVGTCATGEEAVERAADARPDLVLMDIRLAGAIDGVEAAARITAASGCAIVFLTSHADEATLRRAQRARPYGYLVKPFDSVQLRAALATARQRSQERSEPDRAAIQAALDRSEMPSILATYTGRLVACNTLADRILMPERPRTLVGRRLPFWDALEGGGAPAREVSVAGSTFHVRHARQPEQEGFLVVLVPADPAAPDADTALHILRSWVRHETARARPAEPSPLLRLPG